MSEPAPPSQVPAIEMRGVTIGSLKNPGQMRFTNVNWTVAPGEFWVVAAPQYSGKTDFLMTTGGLMAPVEGEYRFFGELMPIFEEPRLRHRLRLGLVFDGGQLFSQLTVAENIGLPLRYHRRAPAAEIDAEVQRLIELTELGEWVNSTPANLGRSVQQRVGLARALAMRPEVLLLDSPLTGLDVRHSHWWLQFLDRLNQGTDWTEKKPMTLVATADDLRPWRRHATRVACLEKDQFLAVGDWNAADRHETKLMGELLQADPG